MVLAALRAFKAREEAMARWVRVQVVPVPHAAADADAAVVKRAKARATRTQLVADGIGLENRLRKLPDAVAKAEKDVCYAEKALAEAERAAVELRTAHAAAADRLDALYDERDAAEAPGA